jgi:hypothetical protein
MPNKYKRYEPVVGFFLITLVIFLFLRVISPQNDDAWSGWLGSLFGALLGGSFTVGLAIYSVDRTIKFERRSRISDERTDALIFYGVNRLKPLQYLLKVH